MVKKHQPSNGGCARCVCYAAGAAGALFTWTRWMLGDVQISLAPAWLPYCP